MEKSLKWYIAINSLAAYSFLFFIVSPLYASAIGISLEGAGFIFSATYAVQAFLSYILGRYFEKRSPNVGIVVGRLIFSIAPLVLALSSSHVSFVVAMILASFFDIFFPSIILFERAIIPPKHRERAYVYMIVVGEMVKFVSYVFLLVPRDSSIFYKAFFVSISGASILYSLLFLLKLPRVRTGSDLPKDHSCSVDKRSFLMIMTNQLFVFLAFNFSGWVIISYYLKEVLNGSPRDLILFEMNFSLGLLTMFFLRWFLRRFDLRRKLFLGTVLMSVMFFVISIPDIRAFYLSNFVFGLGFLLWLPSKEPLKFERAPRELGRWEGLFQGINIFSKIFFPALAAFLASTFSFKLVFWIGGFMLLTAALASLGVRANAN